MASNSVLPLNLARMGFKCEEARDRFILSCAGYWKEFDAGIERRYKLRKINRDIKRAKASGDKVYLDKLNKSSLCLRSKEWSAKQILASLRGHRDFCKHIAAEEAWKSDLAEISKATAAIRKAKIIRNGVPDLTKHRKRISTKPKIFMNMRR